MTDENRVEGGLLAFSAPGRFWRGNLHTHTTASDGTQSLAQVVGSYQQAGYDFLSVTDHFLERYDFPITDATAFDRPDFLTIRGAELHPGFTAAGELLDFLAVGLPEGFSPLPNGENAARTLAENAATLAERALGAGAFVAVAHPAFSGVRAEEIRMLGPIHAVEVWNGGGALHDRGDSWYVLDQLLTDGHQYTAIATDDAHTFAHSNWQKGWVQVKAEELTPSAIVNALKAGTYYSSTGPTLEDVELDAAQERLTIRCSPAELITATGIGTQRVIVAGEDLTEATLDLAAMRRREHRSPFVRVTIRDHQGGRAWSNPIWIEPGGMTDEFGERQSVGLSRSPR